METSMRAFGDLQDWELDEWYTVHDIVSKHIAQMMDHQPDRDPHDSVAIQNWKVRSAEIVRKQSTELGRELACMRGIRLCSEDELHDIQDAGILSQNKCRDEDVLRRQRDFKINDATVYLSFLWFSTRQGSLSRKGEGYVVFPRAETCKVVFIVVEIND
jgi:hypothetical protein